MQEQLTKLEGTGRMGDFVHEGQTMSGDVGFRNVSRAWYDKCITYDQGFEELAKGRAITEDIAATLRQMTPAVSDTGRFVFRHIDGREFVPTDHALEQAAMKCDLGTWTIKDLASPKFGRGKAADTLQYERDRGDAEVIAHLFTNAMRRMELDKVYLWRTRQDGSLRAMLTERYAIINNEWFLGVLKEGIPGGMLSHWRGDSDTIFGNVLIPDTIRAEDDSDYGGMLSVGNCEIGLRRLSSMPSVFRAICMNGCIWDQESGKAIRQVHRGDIKLVELKDAILRNLEVQIPLLPRGIERMLAIRAMGTDGVSMKPIVAEIAMREKLSKRQASAVLKAYADESRITPELGQTLFGLVNSFTRAAQTLENTDWVRFDRVAGGLAMLDDDDWRVLVKRAGSLKAEQVEGAFASAV
jgi:hypothetical protein